MKPEEKAPPRASIRTAVQRSIRRLGAVAYALHSHRIMRLSSPVFEHESAIPNRYTIDGDDASPPLMWAEIPAGTRTLALVVEDPDAPDQVSSRATWVHWVVYNLAPQMPGLAEDASGELPGQAQEGKNDWGHVGYEGPASPVGTHRYLFCLYALDTDLKGLVHPTKHELERAMQGHILDRASLVGTYRS